MPAAAYCTKDASNWKENVAALAQWDRIRFEVAFEF